MINAERNKKNRRKIQDSFTYHKCEKDVECFTGSTQPMFGLQALCKIDLLHTFT